MFFQEHLTIISQDRFFPKWKRKYATAELGYLVRWLMTEVFEDAQIAQMQKCEKCHFSVVILNSLKRQLQHVGTKAYVAPYFTRVCRYISGVRHTQDS